MDVAGVREKFVNAVLDCGGGHLLAPVALWPYLTSAGLVVEWNRLSGRICSEIPLLVRGG